MTRSTKLPRYRFAVPAHSILAVIAIALATLTACEPDTSHIDIEGRPPPRLSQVRALVLIDEPELDAWFSVPGELPVAFNGVPSPGVTGWRPLPIGEATAVLSKNGSAVASGVSTLREGVRHTVVHYGPTLSDEEPTVVTAWIEEQDLEVPEDHILVRVLHGAPDREITAVSLVLTTPAKADGSGDGDPDPKDSLVVPFAGDLLFGAVTVDMTVDVTDVATAGAEDSAAIEGTLLVDTGDVGLTFSSLPLQSDRRYTLVLANGNGNHPALLLLVDEEESTGIVIPGVASTADDDEEEDDDEDEEGDGDGE